MITFPASVQMVGAALPKNRGTAHRAFGRAPEEGDLKASTVAHGALGHVLINRSMTFPADSMKQLLAMLD